MSKNANYFFTLIFLCAATYCAGYLYGHAEAPSGLSALPDSKKVLQLTDNERNTLITLRAENEALKNKLSVFITAQPSIRHAETNNNKTAQTSDCEEKLLASQKIASESQSLLIQKKIESIFNAPDGGESWGKTLDKNFNNEQIDVQWATAEQQKYFSLFAEENELAGFALINAECKSEQCKITVAAKNLEDSNSISDRLANVLRKSNSQTSLMVAPDLQRNSTNLYVSRDGKGFEFN